MTCNHSGKMLYHDRSESTTFEACLRCALEILHEPEYIVDCPHCDARIAIN